MLKRVMQTLTVVLALAASGFTATPQMINYQGLLIDGAGKPVADGNYSVTFTIYDTPSGGKSVWTETQNAITTDGHFVVLLGSVKPILDTVFNTPDRYLGITVENDPELIPRVQLGSVGYALRVNTVDGSTGGVISGDVSIQSDLVVDGDIRATGNLELDDAGNVKAKVWGELYGEIHLFDESGDFTATINATSSSGGVMALGDGAGASTIYMNGGATGDGSVQLPNDAISNIEILDEPGIAQGRSTAGFTLSTLGMIDLTTVTITIPTSGYIFLQGRVSFLFGGTTSFNQAVLQIDETLGGDGITGVHSLIGFLGYSTNGEHFLDCSAQRTYFKSAGTYTFRLEARRFNFANGFAECYYPILTALFIPTSYGSVNTIAEIPGDHPDTKQVTVTGPDDNTHTVYEMDLRYYEEKTRAARIAKQKAELAEAEAELELARAKRQQDTID